MILRERTTQGRTGGDWRIWGSFAAWMILAECVRAFAVQAPIRFSMLGVGWALVGIGLASVGWLATRVSGNTEHAWMSWMERVARFGWTVPLGLLVGAWIGLPAEQLWLTPGRWWLAVTTAGLLPLSGTSLGIGGWVVAAGWDAWKQGVFARVGRGAVVAALVLAASSLFPSIIGWFGAWRTGIPIPDEAVTLSRGVSRLILDSVWWREAPERFLTVPGMEVEESVLRFLMGIAIVIVGVIAYGATRRTGRRMTWAECGWFVLVGCLGIAPAASTLLQWKPVDEVAYTVLLLAQYALWKREDAEKEARLLWTILAMGSAWVVGFPVFLWILVATLATHRGVRLTALLAAWWSVAVAAGRFGGIPLTFFLSVGVAVELGTRVFLRIPVKLQPFSGYFPALAMLLPPFVLGSIRTLLTTAPFAVAYAFFQQQGALTERLATRLTLGYALILTILVAGTAFVS